eukprot:1355555-Prymnesium_polylepis.1
MRSMYTVLCTPLRAASGLRLRRPTGSSDRELRPQRPPLYLHPPILPCNHDPRNRAPLVRRHAKSSLQLAAIR